MTRLLILPLLLLPLALAACRNPAPVDTATLPSAADARVILQGTATYRERIALPADARLTVNISDVSLMDVASPVIAETTVTTGGRQVPLAFSLAYDPGRITANRRYAVSARITEADGQLAWITDTHVDLPPRGQPVALMLVRVAR